MLLADEKGAFKGDGGVHVSQGTVGFPFWGSSQHEELSFGYMLGD